MKPAWAGVAVALPLPILSCSVTLSVPPVILTKPRALLPAPTVKPGLVVRWAFKVPPVISSTPLFATLPVLPMLTEPKLTPPTLIEPPVGRTILPFSTPMLSRPGPLVPERVSVPVPRFTKPRRAAVGPFWIVPEKFWLSGVLTKNHFELGPPFSIVPAPLRPPMVRSLETWTLPAWMSRVPLSWWLVTVENQTVPEPVLVMPAPEPSAPALAIGLATTSGLGLGLCQVWVAAIVVVTFCSAVVDPMVTAPAAASTEMPPAPMVRIWLATPPP